MGPPARPGYCPCLCNGVSTHVSAKWSNQNPPIWRGRQQTSDRKMEMETETEMESASGEVSPYDSDSSAAMFSGPEKHPSTELDFVPTTPPRPGCKSLLFLSWHPVVLTIFIVHA